MPRRHFLVFLALFLLPHLAVADTVVLVAGGDTAYPKGWFDGVAHKRGAQMFEFVQPIFAAADLSFINLESPVTERKAIAEKRYPLTTHPRFLELLVQAGVNLFSLANNHTGDAGPEGLKDTFRHLKRLSSDPRPLFWAGAGLDKKARAQPAIFTVPGKKLRVAFLAFRLGGSPLGNPMANSAAEKQIRAAASQADLVVVSAHGGGEYKDVPGSWKAERWRRFVDAGAHVVLGHGPHNPQGVERYKHGVIYYSLGNFSFGTRPPKRRTGGMLLKGLMARITITDKRITKAEAIPLFVDNTRTWTEGKTTLPVRLFTPFPVTGAHAKAMLTELKAWSAAIRNNRTVITTCGPTGDKDAAYCF